MTEAMRTLIYPLHQDGHASARIGYLQSQERLAYNAARNILNRTPSMPLHGDKQQNNKWHTNLIQKTYAWRHEDPRADAHKSIHLAGACQAWTDNRLMLLRRDHALLNAARGLAVSSRLGSHPRRLRLRSRKHGTSTLSCLEPPVRLDESTFNNPGSEGRHTEDEETGAHRHRHQVVSARGGAPPPQGRKREARQAQIRPALAGCGKGPP